MRFSAGKLLALVGAILVLPVIVYGQEATVSGTVMDVTGGVLPGVTVTAVHEASGNAFEAVTDGQGGYRLPARAGVYRLTAALAGFGTATQSGIEVLVGQQLVVNLRLAPSSLQESVTVTGDAPLIDVVRSELGANIDSRQMSELPVNGRNWMDLTMLAAGSRVNAVSEDPGANGTYQINVDGQQMTQTTGWGFGQPRFSRDAIAEFEFIANRFDATQGRSNGLQVNAITKSGTNTLSGSFSGYFRDDRFNAADFVQKRVLPYSDQQVSGTVGGPIRRDKIHFFANYEYEREPTTFTYSGPYPKFNRIDQTGIRREDKSGVRLDAQVSPQTRMAVRGSKFVFWLPYDPRYTGGSAFSPASAESQNRHTTNLLVTLTQVLGNRALNEFKVGTQGIYWTTEGYANWPDHPLGPTVKGAPLITLRGYQIGITHTTTPQHNGQDDYSLRDDFTYSFNKGGRHTMKAGGEYLYQVHFLGSCHPCVGTYDAQGGAPPANLEDLFPDIMDAATWNLAGLRSITRSYQISVGAYMKRIPRHVYAGWVQDDWQIGRLTLNLGMRYDFGTQIYAERVEVQPWLKAGRSQDTNNYSPRLGFAFSVNDRTVIRGGYGQYFAEVSDQPNLFTRTPNEEVTVQVANDGRPDFMTNPFNGPVPTLEQYFARTCRVASVPGCYRQAISGMASPDSEIPYSHQASIGLQRQVADEMAVQVDYTFNGTRQDFRNQNVNLTYNPATGANYPSTDLSKLYDPAFTSVVEGLTIGRANYHALQSSFTKRLSQRWQASGNYTVSVSRDDSPLPRSGNQVVTFPVAADMGGEYGPAVNDQRHRAVLNGIWDVGHGFQLSGLYFMGSGLRYATTYGGDLRVITGGATNRLRPNGTIVPRNNFVGKSIHRVDLRAQRRFRLGGQRVIDGIVEVYNLFNHENFGSYTTQESNARYGQPSDNTNQAYQSRRLQLGFRATF